MVLEEESNMDTSSIMMSQSRMVSESRMYSVSQQTSKRKFVYSDPEKVLADEEQPEHGSVDTESDHSMSDEDLERDLMAFDKEQAEVIRNINKIGASQMVDNRVEGSNSLVRL